MGDAVRGGGAVDLRLVCAEGALHGHFQGVGLAGVGCLLGVWEHELEVK